MSLSCLENKQVLPLSILPLHRPHFVSTWVDVQGLPQRQRRPWTDIYKDPPEDCVFVIRSWKSKPTRQIFYMDSDSIMISIVVLSAEIWESYRKAGMEISTEPWGYKMEVMEGFVDRPLPPVKPEEVLDPNMRPKLVLYQEIYTPASIIQARSVIPRVAMPRIRPGVRMFDPFHWSNLFDYAELDRSFALRPATTPDLEAVIRTRLYNQERFLRKVLPLDPHWVPRTIEQKLWEPCVIGDPHGHPRVEDVD